MIDCAASANLGGGERDVKTSWKPGPDWSNARAKWEIQSLPGEDECTTQQKREHEDVEGL